MIFDVLTLFPGMFTSFLKESIVGNAVESEAVEVYLTDIRDFSGNKHRKVDDYPFGGGAGMVMKPEPIYRALENLSLENETPVIYFTPQGRLLNQQIVNEYSTKERIVIVCGHYKDIDQRIRDNCVTDEISIGDYVISGGELPAMIFIDAIARLQEGVLNDINSAKGDSHWDGLLGTPQYTRPLEFNGWKVPDVLLSGHHKNIEKWRSEKSLELTKKIRPDLLDE